MRRLFGALLFVVLLVRVAVPPGFMPTSTENGIVISICTGTGPLETVIDDDRYAPLSKKKQQHEAKHECEFAAAAGGGLILPAVTGLAQALPLAPVPTLGAVIAHLTVSRLATPPPPARGPPAHA